MCEQSIIGARASVMVYDDAQKKWVPSGTSSGLSKVQIYHHQQNNTFRVVGRKLQDHEVVINCSILKSLKYNQATATFHQWRDSKYVYGLNFSSQQDAEAFARAMMHALEVLSGRVIPNTAPPQPPNGYEEDMGYRTMTREDAAIALQQQQNITGTTTPSVQTPTSQNPHMPQSPLSQQGHHRTSSAPPAPQPPPMSMPQQIYQQASNGINQQQQLPQPPTQQQMQQQMQQQSMYHSAQTTQQMSSQQHHPIYSTQASVNNYIQASGQSNHHQNGSGPIFQQQNQGIPTSSSTNSVGGFVGQSQQQTQHNNYGQTNGTTTTDGMGMLYGQVQVAPVIPPMLMQPTNSNSVEIRNNAPAAPPPPPTGFGGSGNFAPSQPAPPIPQLPSMGPPQPPAMMSGLAPPPPPPPPMGGLLPKSDEGGLMGSLAAQLQQAKLKKNKSTPPPTENSGSSTSSGGSGNYGTIGRTSHGMASMMDEMAKTLARRRAQAEKKEPEPNDDNNSKQRPWEKSNTLPHKLGNASNVNSNNGGNSNSGSESPRPIRKRFGSASEETILKQVNGDGLSLSLCADLDSIKAELIREMRLEIQKAKQDIIDAIKLEFTRR